MAKLQPMADRVIIKPIPKEEVTKAGIVLPDTAKEKPQEGKVVSAGPGRLGKSYSPIGAPHEPRESHLRHRVRQPVALLHPPREISVPDDLRRLPRTRDSQDSKKRRPHPSEHRY